MDAAMALPAEERLEVATELMASVGGPADPEWESLWAAELEHRVRDAEASGDHGEPWEVVRDRLFDRR